MSKLSRHVGYGFGDMSSSMFWKVFSYYLPFFYSNIFGLSLKDAGIILLVTRIWDAVSDPMMGILADRTQTRWGKYRPYLLFVAPLFSIAGILLFTTPDWGYTAKLVWAYATYILMMTVYTGINVPYGAMLGVMTADSQEKTVYSSFRMFFAYGGSFLALFLWEPLCNTLGGYDNPQGWFWAMVVIASACFVLFICCFLLTKEELKTVSTVSIGSDFKALLSNKPWWILIGAALCFNLFCTVRGATVAYYFADIIPAGATLNFQLGDFFQLSTFHTFRSCPWAENFQLLFYAGLFLAVGEVSNMIGVATCVPLAAKFGKKTTFIAVNVGLCILSILFFFIPVSQTGFWLMLLAQILISMLTGVMSPLVWSMYADVSDYAEQRYKTASTGLIFSSSSMAQKFGGAIGGSAALWLLAACGYISNQPSAVSLQPDSALLCLRYLMSFIPAAVSLLAVLIVSFYPLTTAKMAQIDEQLKFQRQHAQ
jgi:GPH family glycoside/pentoside/hexuronide:cation symporter